MNRLPRRGHSARWLRLAIAIVLLAQAILPITHVQIAQAASILSLAFAGGISVGNNYYAKGNTQLTLTVTTGDTTKCVEITGAGSVPRQTSGAAQSTWVFHVTTNSVEGAQQITVKAGSGFNNNNCSTQVATVTANIVVDNTGPIVSGNLQPTPNAAGWNNSDVTINWQATDAATVASGPTPAVDQVTTDTGGIAKSATATDGVGNVGSGSVTVKLDKTAPTLTSSRSPAPNANGWNKEAVTVNFTCSDGLSGIKICVGSQTFSTDGANFSGTGTATDNADNTATATVGNINIDRSAPSLSGAPAAAPNSAGWYNSDVTVHWVASDALSGLSGSAPADNTIASEGTGLTASASVSDKAGNTVNATSSPTVKIDKTAPNTTATAPADWNNTDVNVILTGFDALSGVSTTFYALDGSAPQSGTGVAISTEGVHTLQFWSVDNAGNTETAKSVQVKIDKTPPTINHSQAPVANGNGWNKSDVTVTFVCGDNLSGLASCTAPQTVAAEGKNQSVTGTAVDNAGNSATDPATVSIDKTVPMISAAPDRAPNSANWYNNDVTISFVCSDALSGIDLCPTPHTLVEGANQSASGVATDAAENSSSAGVSGINIDKTAPSLSGAVTSIPSGPGWYNADVVVAWTCSDALSGIVACPGDSTISGEGANLSTNTTVADNAGNSTGTAVSGINIDRTPPSTSASIPDPLPSGWHDGPVQVTLDALDSLSGVKTTYFSVDNNPGVEYTGSFVVSTGGEHSVQFFSVDNAGNSEDYHLPGHTITFKIDNLAPTITGSRSPVANGKGWNNTPVTISFACADQESGIASCSDPVTISGEGQDQAVDGQASDNAGNTAGTTVTDINIDLTPPSTSDDGPSGWQKADVTVNLAAIDNLSGVDYTEYSLNGSLTQNGTSITVATEGTHSLQYRSIDNAGNAEAVITAAPIQLDKTLPIINGTTDRPANSSGWYKANVTVSFSCSDALSGLASCSPTGDLGEGTNQSVTGTAADNAGNTASLTVSGINVDKTPPSLNGAPTTTPNAAGWYNDDVTIAWTAADVLSGLEGALPPNSILAEEGTNRTASATVKDLAGNETSASSSPAVNIDKTKPTISGAADRLANASGWYNADVTVGFTCNDTLSGIDTCSGPKILGAGANQSTSGSAVDKAGNSTTATVNNINVDKTAPTIGHNQTPAANSSGWNNTDVTVTFACEDDLSGVATCTGPQAIAAEGKDQAVAGAAADNAGNTAADQAMVSIDKTKPAISGAADRSPNGAGWYKADVTVTFTCADSLSGLASCTIPQTFGEGNNQAATGAAVDKAGNTAGTTISPIRVDKTEPTITWNGGPADGGVYYFGSVPAAPTCTAIDALSGPNGCTVSGYSTAVGNAMMTATGYDVAGNQATGQRSYTVKGWTASGFFQPVDMTSSAANLVWNTVKNGSTVPLKFRIFAGATELKDVAAVKSLTSAQVVCTAGTEDAVEEVATTTGGTVLRYDTTGGQFVYNWATPKKAGNCYRVTMTGQDSSTIIAYFKLK